MKAPGGSWRTVASFRFVTSGVFQLRIPPLNRSVLFKGGGGILINPILDPKNFRLRRAKNTQKNFRLRRAKALNFFSPAAGFLPYFMTSEDLDLSFIHCPAFWPAAGGKFWHFLELVTLGNSDF